MRVNAVQRQLLSVAHPGERTRGPIKTETASFQGQTTNEPVSVITFGGLKNKNQVAFALAELPPFMKVGGVATVGNDYMNMGDWLEGSLKKRGLPTEGVRVGMFIPYYNGDVKHDRRTGYPTGRVDLRYVDGQPVFVSPDVLSKMSMEEAVQKKMYTELEQVSSQKMPWSVQGYTNVALLKVKNPPISQQNVDIYMVFNDATASMKKAYDGGMSGYSSASKVVTDAFKGDPYAKFSKAFVETLPALEESGFSPETIICSDAQTAFVAEYAARHNLAGDEYFKGLKVTQVLHNMGPGYCGETSAKNMFSNFASKEQIEAVFEDPEYFKALREGQEEQYFKQFVKMTLGADGTPNPDMIPLRHLEDGFVTAVDTVSEGYAEAAAKNPNVSPSLYPTWSKLYSQGKAGGILNGFEDPKVSASKPINLEGYSKEQTVVDKAGKTRVFEPFEIFKKKSELTFEDMLETKRKNKINLLSRLSGDIDENLVITGNANRSAKLIGHIDPKYVEMLKNGENVPMFEALGRGDVQKAFPVTLRAFEKFAKTPEGKNAVLVVGASLVEGQEETAKIQGILGEILADKDLNGRVAFLNGFGPSYAMASASDAMLVPSKFAPCELVDLEAQKYYTTPIVANTQGLAQKNFDPRIPTEAAKANAYKTVHEFDMPDEIIERITKAYTGDDKTLQAKVMGEFSLVDEERFKKFGSSYNELLKRHKAELSGRVDPEFLDNASVKSLRASNDYRKLLIELKEGILVDELADAMQVRVKNMDNETARTIFKNQLTLKTGWTRNGALHPSGKSSWELYKTRHIDPKPRDATGSVFNFVNPAKKISSVDRDTFVSFSGEAKRAQFMNAKENALAMTAKIGNLFKDKRIVAVATGATALIVGLWALRLHNKSQKPETSPEKVELPPVTVSGGYYTEITTVKHTANAASWPSSNQNFNKFSAYFNA